LAETNLIVQEENYFVEIVADDVDEVDGAIGAFGAFVAVRA
jgi:hypothetical protein